MNELKDTADRPERAFLVGAYTDETPKPEAESLLRELGGLAKTLGLEVVGSCQARIRTKNPAYLLGSGKMEEIIESARESRADSIVFDERLSPVQQRNWEQGADLKVFDRAELIIRIFAARASTKEASLQIELAELQYSLPRLAHSYSALSRQRGGRYGTKGKGEQKLELDRREIERRITAIKEELKVVRKSRETQKKQRERVLVPRAAIVGYTNSGKSSLLNALTKAGVLAEDKLFATLDPTTRRIALRSGAPLLLTDTVGFVRNLPHGLVEAFKSTLEVAVEADVLVQIADASDPDMARHIETTRKVLAEIGAGDRPSILALNKIDAVADAERLSDLAAFYPGSHLISVREGRGLDGLLAAIEGALTQSAGLVTLRVPDAHYALVALARREGFVSEERHDGEATILVARIPERIAPRFAPYEIASE